jgi:hypothetical protein
VSETNPITTLRLALEKLLATTFPNAEILPGMREQVPSRDRDRISIFWEATPTAPNVNYAQPRMRIRYWKKLAKGSKLTPVPRDETELEQVGWDLAAMLMLNRTVAITGDQGVFYEIVSVAPVRDEWAVEAILGLRTQMPNPNPIT